MKLFKIKNLIVLITVLIYIYLLFHIYGRSETNSTYPSRPIVIIVHSKPGSGIDLMARKISDIIRIKKYSNVPFVIENRSGTQGLVAMQYVLDKEPDGYTMLAVTKSFLSTLMVNKSRVEIEDFKFVSAMLFDPEAIITNIDSSIKNIKDLIREAEEMDGKQVWIGPGTGGRDHIMAIKTWEKLGIRATWIDYKSGPQSVLALMRNEASVYVGNPIDIRGKKDLKVISIAAPSRLQILPEIKTFREQGYELNEYMWRGFAFPESVDPERIKYMNSVLFKVGKDPEWLQYCKEVFALPLYMETDKISELVNNEMDETRAYLNKANLLKNYTGRGPVPVWTAGVIILFLLTILLLFIVRFNLKRINQEMVMSTFFIWLALFFLYQISLFSIPDDLNITDPALVPLLWIILLIVLSVIQFFRSLKGADTKITHMNRNTWKVLLIILLLIIYFVLIPLIGYFISTAFLIAVLMIILNFRDPSLIVISSTGFVIFSYLVFQLLLHIDLPAGRIFN